MAIFIVGFSQAMSPEDHGVDWVPAMDGHRPGVPQIEAEYSLPNVPLGREFGAYRNSLEDPTTADPKAWIAAEFIRATNTDDELEADSMAGLIRGRHEKLLADGHSIHPISTGDTLTRIAPTTERLWTLAYSGSDWDLLSPNAVTRNALAFIKA